MPRRGVFGKKATDYVIFMASVSNNHLCCVRLKAWPEVIVVPLPLFLTYYLAVSILLTADEIVDECEVRTMACNASTNASTEVTTTSANAPIARGGSGLAKAIAKVLLVKVNEVTALSTKALNQ